MTFVAMPFCAARSVHQSSRNKGYMASQSSSAAVKAFGFSSDGKCPHSGMLDEIHLTAEGNSNYWAHRLFIKKASSSFQQSYTGSSFFA